MKRWIGYSVALSLCAAVTALSAPGCGSGGPTCESVSDELCAKACECGGGSKCAFGDMSGSISFKTKDDCLSLIKLGCGSSKVDFAACSDAIDSTKCSGDAFPTPAACNSTK